MNMDNFQQFIAVLNWINTDSRTERVPHWSYMGDGSLNKSKFYEKIGITDPEAIKKKEEDRSKMMIDNIQWGLKNAHFFEIDKIEKRLLLMTEAPKDKRILQKVKLPYMNVFLDVDINKSEVDDCYECDFEQINGVLITKVPLWSIPRSPDEEIKSNHMVSRDENGNLKASMTFKKISTIDDSQKQIGEMYYVAYCGTTNKGITFINDLLIPIDIDAKTDIHYHDKSDLKFFRDFIINLILFIENPEVEWIDVVRSDKNTQRRLKQNKLPLPSSQKVRLTGKIKRYVSSIQNDIMHDSFDFRFWVRGFWREYRSDKYKEMKGKIQFIEPFMKGKGELRNRIYSVEAGHDDIKAYQDNYIFMDDIKPLDKPLAGMSQKLRQRKR
jgi:hypothetical protein